MLPPARDLAEGSNRNPMVELVERAQPLARLEELLDARTRQSRGRVVLVAGEAGVGKTALLRRFFASDRREQRVVWGACDPLFTPRPLGPLLDISEQIGGDLSRVVAAGARPHEVTSALMRTFREQPVTVLVLEDIHWADEATLDVVRLLARRIATVDAVIVGSYRDDALGRAHPLQLLLGELASSDSITRLKLEPLSPEGVAVLARRAGVDAAELYRRTGGNPFFVTEVLAAGSAIPATVRDAVLARAARLTPPGWSVLEAVATVPPHAEPWLLESMVEDAERGLEECLSSGMLMTVPAGVSFRHDLARLAVEASITPNRAVALHRRALAALLATPAAAGDPARLAHHADAAGDVQAVVRFAVAAGQRATSLGAHREAAAQYGRALRFAADLPDAQRAELLERYAYACYVTGHFIDTVDAQRQAVECHRRTGDVRKEGDALRSLSRWLRYVGRTQEAVDCANRAVALLEDLPRGHELAMAYNTLSSLYMAVEDADGTVDWGMRALELARELDDVEATVHALTNIGSMQLVHGDPDAIHTLQASIELSDSAGQEEHSGRAWVNLVWWAPRSRSYWLLERYLSRALEYCTERGLDLWRLMLLAARSRFELDSGRWDDALATAAVVSRDPRTAPVARITALAVTGAIRARRGEPGYTPLLDEAWELARVTAELQKLEPVAVVRAEAACLEGRRDGVAEATEVTMRLAAAHGATWILGELALWRCFAGVDEQPPDGIAEPYALLITRDATRAADVWTALGCPYESALALAGSDDEALVRSGLDTLNRLRARATSALVARWLRDRGYRRLPRGPRATTLGNPAALTKRELDVLAFVAQGLRNGEIARRLFLSEKTVDHHVSAILGKLGTPTRAEATVEAKRLHLVP